MEQEADTCPATMEESLASNCRSVLNASEVPERLKGSSLFTFRNDPGMKEALKKLRQSNRAKRTCRNLTSARHDRLSPSEKGFDWGFESKLTETFF